MYYIKDILAREIRSSYVEIFSMMKPGCNVAKLYLDASDQGGRRSKMRRRWEIGGREVVL